MITPAVPELYEEEHQSAVDVRTDTLQTLRELGPPDLVHLVKQPNNSKSVNKQFGVYHHVTGVDASSSASLAAYVNTLTYSLSDSKTHKVVSGVYCCYNAFSRLDMRVQVTIPGSVESFCIDERGDKRVATDALWLETYLCGVLRAYSYADDGSGDAVKRIIGCRRFNPITNTEAEHRFLAAAERLFFNGWQLGSDPEIQVPNLVSNHLTTGLLKYIKTTGRYASGINLFEKLRVREPEISALLAQVLIAADEEVKAVQLLHEAIQELPMDYSLLDAQATFCSSKGRSDLALEVALRSVISAPSEFSTWAKLAEIYIGLEQWELALLTLNSCPMFTYADKDAPRPLPAERVHLPILPETACDEIDDSHAANDVELVHPTLRKLVASTFKGTFQRAYMLLTEITKRIGWDQLLRIRSQVFVMEEEYRTERVYTRSGSVSVPSGHGKPEANNTNGDSSSGADPELSKPPQTVTAEVVHAGSDNITADASASGAASTHSSNPDSVDPTHTDYTSFRNKRLCERWLDNLFMVLYEDLRVYTIWRTEVAQYRTQQLAYKKSAEEWEILGELSQRLHHDKEAVEAWQACLGTRFSPKAMLGVMRAWEEKGDVKGTVGAVIRLVCWQYRWYSEFSPPLFQTIRRLIEDEGALKIRSMVQATSLPQHVLDLTNQYAELCAAFRSSGSDI